MGALLHLMDWHKVQHGLEFTVAAAFLLASFSLVIDRWNDRSGEHAEQTVGSAAD